MLFRSKLAASAFDRLGMLLIGSVLVPSLVQGSPVAWRASLWVIIGVVLHLLAYVVLRYLRVED